MIVQYQYTLHLRLHLYGDLLVHVIAAIATDAYLSYFTNGEGNKDSLIVELNNSQCISMHA